MRPDDGRGQRVRRLDPAVIAPDGEQAKNTGAGTSGPCEFAVLL